jgi:hypothetical protein
MHLLTNEVLLASDDALTQMLGARIKTLWDARRSVDASRLTPLLTDDYTAVHPDGTLHVRKPTEQEIALEEIDHYQLTHLRAAPVGPEGALVTYIAEIGIASHIAPTVLKCAVGEVWIKQLYDWKCRYSQATVVK